MKLYVAGPMTGIPQFNFPEFDRVAAELRQAVVADMRSDPNADRMFNGRMEVVSPAELDNPKDRAAALASKDGSILDYGKGVKKTWGQFLARDIKLIVDDPDLDGIVVLDGWAESYGARFETFSGVMMRRRPVVVVRYQGTSYGAAQFQRVNDIDLYRAWCAEPNLVISYPMSAKPQITEEYA